MVPTNILRIYSNFSYKWNEFKLIFVMNISVILFLREIEGCYGKNIEKLSSRIIDNVVM